MSLYMHGRLVDAKTGAPIEVGDLRLDFRGDPLVVTGWEAPSHPGSTGRVYVRVPGDEGERSYFPSVINAKVVEV